MPASPEVCDRGGDVRVVEVLEKVEAEHFTKTYRHIGIA